MARRESDAMIAVVQKPVAKGNWRVGPGIPRGVRGVGIHVTEGNRRSVESWFNNPAADVSSHFMVCLDGTLVQFVGIHDIANTQGIVDRPSWPYLIKDRNPNEYLVSIEHEGDGVTPWPEAQVLTSTVLSAWLALRFKMQPTPQFFVKHNQIRKSKPCPGPAFDRIDYLSRVEAIGRVFGPDTVNLISGIR
jgi:N-acetyl-anhydromuramyl-L-alanine amidase AmpD